ncbi:HD phosphohydrolase domain-containing protein [Blastocladiella britannica]|nr:HD phosphohydrolase domain-containing protein [Blastocladiella britannica]
MDTPIENLRTIHDPIHGLISLDALSWSCIDTPHFQRLRELKQMGTAYHVFPGASHNRFEHSIGVGHLAGQMIQRLHSSQPNLEISQEDAGAIQIAGLCHDLGHGPYSHVFDGVVIPAITGNRDWSHEQASLMMFDHMVSEHSIDLSPDQCKLVKSLIDGQPVPGSRKFLFQIVSNKETGIDVDRLDYIARDCYNVGLKSSYDPARLMHNFRVIGDEICFQSKDAFNLYELFHTRYSLFKRIYTHKSCNAIDLMVSDALVAANSVFHFDEALSDPEQYLRLTDGIVRDIEFSTNPELEYSQSILKRLRTRDLYRFCDELLLDEMPASYLKRHLTPELIAGHLGASSGVTADDIRLEMFSIHYGQKARDPVLGVQFYSKYDQLHKLQLKDSDASMLIPSRFCEWVVRVFATDLSKVILVQKAFRAVVEPMLSMIGSSVSPSKKHEIPMGTDLQPTPSRKRSFVESTDSGGSGSPLVQKVARRDWTK